jgi:hypothetical protein
MDAIHALALTGDFSALVQACEEYELDACNFDQPAHLYGLHLMAYLLADDLNNARHCWRRIPAAIKTSTPELISIWSVGQSLWKRQVFPVCYPPRPNYNLSSKTETTLQRSKRWPKSSGTPKLPPWQFR